MAIDQVVGHYKHLLLKKIFLEAIQKQMHVRDASSYFITELSTNVYEHAKAKALLVTESALAGEFALITGDACCLKLARRPAS